ncbi:hypothetical protein [Streptomyces sp. NPDC049881]|uniref:hypothetical protein n=1 Tax=Streptomyces sp. NPDC049881 TaxID=3155778 RepID=UPI0034489F4F
MLGGDDQQLAAGGRPWWFGTAVAGAGFLLLIAFAVVVNVRSAGEPGGPVSGASVVADDGGDTAPTATDDVPTGYPRTEEGAVQAAVNYQMARSSVAYMTDRAVRHRVINAMATSGSVKSLTRTDDSAMDLVLASLGLGKRDVEALVARAAPLGVRIAQYSERAATVDVWLAGLIGTTDARAPLPVSASWNTYTVTLRWEADDWKLAAVSAVPGPTPLDTGDGVPSTAEDFRRADEEFDAPPYLG